MTLIQDDDVAEALLAKRAHHALGNAVRLWTPERAEQGLYTDCSRPSDEGLAEAGVTVTEEEARLVAPRCRLDKLTPDPIGGGMSGHVQVGLLPNSRKELLTCMISIEFLVRS